MLRAIRYGRLGIAVVLGVVTSVGVAWGVHNFNGRWKHVESAYAVDRISAIRILRLEGFGTRGLVQRMVDVKQLHDHSIEMVHQFQDSSVTLPRLKERPHDLREFGVESDVLFRMRAGFPMLCVEMKWDESVTPGNSQIIRRFGSLRVGKSTLPASPLWVGLAVNTACYGAAWYLVLVAPRLLLAWSRSRSRKCPACGYDMQGLAVATCPECGKG